MFNKNSFKSNRYAQKKLTKDIIFIELRYKTCIVRI